MKVDTKGASADRRAARQKRIVAEVPEHIHRLVRLRCADRAIQIRDYLLELLARDGIG